MAMGKCAQDLESNSPAKTTINIIPPSIATSVNEVVGQGTDKDSPSVHIDNNIEFPVCPAIQNTEDVLRLCGDAGPWQIRIYFLAFFAGIPAALQDFLYIFIGYIPEDYWCSLPECSQYSFDTIKNLTIPSVDSNGRLEYEKCSRFSWEEPFNSTCSWLDGLSLTSANKTESCSTYEYDTSVLESTIVTEYNLVCGNEFWTSTSQAVYALGSLTGSILFGIISDNYGRKRAICLSLMVSIVFGPIVAYSPNYTMLLVSRFLLAIGSPSIYDVTYILTIEMIGPEWRGIAGNAFGVPYALGYAALAPFAYFLRNWRTLQLALTVPAILFLLIVLFFLPESPRFLISKGKAREAEKILRDIAKGNGRLQQLPHNFSQIILKLSSSSNGGNEEEKKLSWSQVVGQFFTNFWGLLRTPKMRTRTLVLNFAWLSVVLIYFGIALNAPNLSANLFIYTFLSGILEVPSYLIVPPLIKYLGRRLVFSGLLFICGTSLALSLLFETGSTAIVSLALVGMFHIGSAYALIFLYAIELMPTSLRTYGIGSAAVTGKIGNAAAPYITNLMGRSNKKAPTIVFVVVSFVAGAFSLLLPETKGKTLPESVEDVENS